MNHSDTPTDTPYALAEAAARRLAELTGYGDWAGRLAGIPEYDRA